MIWIAATLLLFAASGIAIVSIRRRRRRRTVSVIVPEDLAERVESATRAFAAASPWQPASSPGAPAAAAAIEAALIAGEPRRALEAAESALAAAPESAGGRVWLAWALCANGQPAGALHQLARVGVGPGAGTGVGAGVGVDVSGGSAAEPEPAGPLAAYVVARAEHLQFEHDAGAIGPVPPLVTTADLAVLTLASGRGAATWLTGPTEVQLSADQVRAAVAEHRQITARCLSLALSALEAAPGFTDAAYLVARLTVKAGLLPAGRALFDAIAPRITGRPDADSFERDRKDLADPASAVAAAKLAPPPPPPPDSPTAKRSKSLRVLS